MIDNATILFTTGMVVFVIVRAALLNRTMPWFTHVEPAVRASGWSRASARARPWRAVPDTAAPTRDA